MQNSAEGVLPSEYVARNKARDAAAEAALTQQGWRVETIWECDLKDAEALRVRLEAMLQRP